jgi:hypothetical protein
MPIPAVSPDQVFFAWTFPGCPVRVSLSLEVVQAVQRGALAISESTAEAKPFEAKPSEVKQGLLLGYLVNGSTRITSFLPVADLGAQMSRAIQSSGRCAVGFYRVRPGDTLQLDEQESVAARDMFQRAGAVVLLVEPRAAGPAEATFFFFERNLLCGGYLHFPFDAAFLAERELRVVPSDSARLRESLRASPLPALPPATAPRTSPRQPRNAMAMMSLALAGVAAGAGLTQLFRTAPPNDIAIVPVQARPAGDHAVSPIEIRAQRRGRELKIIWDPVIGSPGSSGTLSIIDGATNQVVPLDREQLQSGIVPYRPASDQVKLDLAVSHGTVVDARGTLLVLLPARWME